MFEYKAQSSLLVQKGTSKESREFTVGYKQTQGEIQNKIRNENFRMRYRMRSETRTSE